MIEPFSLMHVLWTTWVVVWLLAAAWSARTIARQSSGSRLAHTLPMAAGAALVFLRPALLGPLADPLFPQASWVAWVACVMVAVGLGFSVWARVHLGRNWSGTVTLKERHTVIRSGPYALTRHPIYTGLLLALTGTMLARDSVAALVGLGLSAVGIVIKLRQEERLMLEHFGPAYSAYRAEVAALIPGLW
jgi:protein-S-isoprenylcysteine O-methyltransferase Ste14